MQGHRHDLREEARRYDASQGHDAGRRGVIDHRGDEAVARRETPRPAQPAWQTEPGDFDDAHAGRRAVRTKVGKQRSEEHTSELQSLMRISYAVFCLKQKMLQ